MDQPKIERLLRLMKMMSGNVNYVQKKEMTEHIELLGQAILEKKRVILKSYESSHSHEVGDRFIEPFEFTTNCIDIWGYDLEKKVIGRGSHAR